MSKSKSQEKREAEMNKDKAPVERESVETPPTETQKTEQVMPNISPENKKPDGSQPNQATGSIAGTESEDGKQIKVGFGIEQRAEYGFTLMPTGNDDKYFMVDKELWDEYTSVKSQYDKAYNALVAAADRRQEVSG